MSIPLLPAYAAEQQRQQEAVTDIASHHAIPAGTHCLDHNDSGECIQLLDPKTKTVYKKSGAEWLYEEHDTDLVRKLAQ